MFASENIVSHKSKMTCFEVLFLPTVDVIYCTYKFEKEKKGTYYCVFCKSECVIVLYITTQFLFVYMFVLLHAVKSNYNRI